MGDCVNLRCVQEKRHFKKELATWHKKVPYSIGLELVAENLAGNASGHIKTLLLPFNDMELDEIEDFKPPSETACTFCEGKSSRDPSEQENIPEMLMCSEKMTSSQIQKSSADHRYNPCNETTVDSTPTTSTTLVPELPVLEGLNSFYNQLAMSNLLYQQQQQMQSAAAVQTAFGAGTSSSSQRQQPAGPSLGIHPNADLSLDLSSETCEVSGGLMSSESKPGSLKVPEIRSKKKKDNSLKRSYTDRELNAAVEAIKSGTIGTRRAAQMFGVPRSTLRNKVFKSAEMNRQLPYNQEHLLTGVAAAALGDRCHSPGSNSESGSSLPNSKHASPRGKAAEEQMPDMTQFNNALLKQLEEPQANQTINEQLSILSQQRLLSDMFNPLQFALSATAGYPFLMPQYSALSAMPGMDYMNPYASSMLMPYLPEVMKSLAQRQLGIERIGQTAASRQSSSARRSDHTPNAKHPKDDIKVPAYKPSTANHLGNDHDSATKVGKSIKKEQASANDLPQSTVYPATDYLQSMISQSPSTSKRTSPLSSHTPAKKPFGEPTQSTHSMSNGNTSGKKRPKRGQYRKYDSERLADAVKAVQRGEMSVHRAGTHYGVPHSTLEYKVKERHLLRKKKIAENGDSKIGVAAALGSKPPTSNAMSNHSTDSDETPLKPLLSSIKPERESPSQETAASDKNADGFMDFSPSTYHMDTPASELLMKLHAKAHERANEIIKSGCATNIESNDNLSNVA